MLFLSILPSTVFHYNSLHLFPGSAPPWECVVLLFSVEIICFGEILRVGGQENRDGDEKMYLLYLTQSQMLLLYFTYSLQH